MTSVVSKSDDNSIIATMMFGRFQPPHRSHGHLIDLLIEKAHQTNGTPFVFTSKKSNDFNNPSKLQAYLKIRSGTKKKKVLSENPIAIKDKLNILNEMHGDKPVIIVDVEKENISNPYDAINWLVSQGFTKIYFLAGSDRISSYESMISSLSDRVEIELIEIPRSKNAVSGTRVRNVALETSLSDVINTARLYGDIYGDDKCLHKINEIIRIIDLIQKGTVIPEVDNTTMSDSSRTSSKNKYGGRKSKRRTRKKSSRRKKKKEITTYSK